jgi:hypothetical protein
LKHGSHEKLRCHEASKDKLICPNIRGQTGDLPEITSLWKSFWHFLRKLYIVLPEDPVIPLMVIYPEEVPTDNKNACSTMFIAALFLIARSWKQPRSSSVEECMQNKCGSFTQRNTTQLLKMRTS